MQEKYIDSFIDCGVIILYSSPEEFKEWAEKRSIDVSVDFDVVVGCNDHFSEDGIEILQYVWVSSTSGNPVENVIATLAHEATHVIDNIEIFIANNPGSRLSERIPREIRARVVEKIVLEGSRFILADFYGDKQGQ